MDITRRQMVMGGSCAALSGAIMAPINKEGRQYDVDDPIRLRERANKKGLFVGSCIDFSQINDEKLKNNLKKDCNIIVPENGFNWTRIQRTPGAPLDFSEAEAVAAVAERMGVALRGHNLVWYRTMPSWVTELVSAMTPTQAADLMVSHVKSVASRWRSRVIHQEPVNEPTEAPGRLRQAVFGEKLGEHYIDLAFEAAREADPEAVLFINESGIEQETDWQIGCRKTFLGLLERLNKRNVPIDAVGVQGHLALDAPFSERAYAKLLRDISDMGYKILITEFDVRDRGAFGGIASRDAAVAAIGKAFLDVSFDNPACGGVLNWAHVDKYSWLRKTANAQRLDGQLLRPSPLDDNYRLKPLWHAMAAAIEGASKRSCIIARHEYSASVAIERIPNRPQVK